LIVRSSLKVREIKADEALARRTAATSGTGGRRATGEFRMYLALDEQAER
jgi:hypothetical protein